LKGEEPIFGSFIDVNYPATILREYVDNIYKELMNNFGESEIIKLFDNKKTVKAIFIYCSTTSTVMANNYPLVTRLNTLRMIKFGNVPVDVDNVLNNLNHQLQLIK
jgi:hypothetical protein